MWKVRTSNFTLNATHRLEKLGGENHRDSTAGGRGTPNYLSGLAVSKDGSRLLIASNKMNSEKGLLTGPDLDQDNTVRNLISILDTASGQVVDSLDIDNSDSATAVAFSPLGDYFVVTLQGNNDIAVFDFYAVSQSAGLGGLMTRQRVGSAPQGLVFDSVTRKLIVKNFLSRDLSIFDLSDYLATGKSDLLSNRVSTVENETLSPEILLGKQLFYHASDPRMSAEGYMSCVTCHRDGGFDGRTWDFTGRGEGLRNTTSLNGRGGLGMGNLHWSANFDEVQDFEHDIRNAFGGSGFLTNTQFASVSTPGGTPKAGLSPDLDALAAYLGSLNHDHLPKSPHRTAAGTLTSSASTGAAIFLREGCATCHTGTEMTDGRLHDVGTLSSTSGKRLHETLTGIETPTLRGLWESAPYLHDGSADSLDDVFRITGGTNLPAENAIAVDGTEITTEWTYYNNDETVRGEAYAEIRNGGRLIFNGVDGGTGGIGSIALRYSSGYENGTLRIRVNGVNYTAAVVPTGNQPDWRYVNWSLVRISGVALSPGTVNQVEISVLSPDWLPVGIDEIIVSTPDKIASAQPHLRAAGLNATERRQLNDYLLQLDGSPIEGLPSNAPETPGSLTLSTTGGELILLNWGASPGTFFYRIYRSSGNDFATAEILGEAATTGFASPAPTGGTSFFYWVTASNEQGESAAGDGIIYVPLPPSTPQPDLSLGEDLLAMSGVDSFPIRQLYKQNLAQNSSAKTWLKLENREAEGGIRLSSTRGSRNFQLRYLHLDSQRTNVTATITTNRLTFLSLSDLDSETLQIVTRHKGRKNRFTIITTARASADESRKDNVRLNLRVR